MLDVHLEEEIEWKQIAFTLDYGYELLGFDIDGISLEHLEDSLLLTVLCSPLASRGQQSLFDCPL
jgi:hypothetical protein